MWVCKYIYMYIDTGRPRCVSSGDFFGGVYWVFSRRVSAPAMPYTILGAMCVKTAARMFNLWIFLKRWTDEKWEEGWQEEGWRLSRVPHQTAHYSQCFTSKSTNHYCASITLRSTGSQTSTGHSTWQVTICQTKPEGVSSIPVGTEAL